MTQMTNLLNTLSPDEMRFVRLIDLLGGQSWIVGGAVRDAICGRQIKDIDLEVGGVSPETLETLPNWVVRPAGDRFAVWMVSPGPDFNHDRMFEICVPHTRQAHGYDRMNETAVIDIWLPIGISLGRRDFTCNAMAVNAITGEFVDPFGGQSDLLNGVLRAVNADNFGHDPVRVLRGMRFASTHDLTASPETVQAASEHVAGGSRIDANRMRNEWLRWAQGVSPANGLDFLRAAGWLIHFPALGNLDGIQQHPEWHPEGDALTHTILAVQALNNADPIAVWATLLHDIGKARMQDDDGTAHGHDDVGAEMVPDFFRSIGFQWNTPPEWVRAVQALVREHMRHVGWNAPTRRAVRRLARDLEPATVRQWAAVCMADMGGRGPTVVPDVEVILNAVDVAEGQHVLDEGPQPVLQGRHLIDLGMQPGPHFGVILEAAMQAQLDGGISDLDDAVAWLNDFLN